ncbi:virulence factor TspB C-terminal domain-related protein [Dyella sp.]|uniref:virulence factor TspB C-terminal domain-related protein n=1 Tax=Dyella sp. TaxID=1869338 RepID=UPI003F7D46EC
MDSHWRWLAGGLAFALVLLGVPLSSSATGVMPNVQPISVQPVGVAPGGGIQARYTYEMRLPLAAANDAGVTAAANEATYATRLVTIARTTGGGILEGGVALGSRAIPWVAAAYTAYQLYKWYTDAQGRTYKPGETVPAVDCVGGAYFSAAQFSSCTAAGLARKLGAYYTSFYHAVTDCLVGGPGSNPGDYRIDCTGFINDNTNAGYHSSGAPTSAAEDPYTTDPSQVPLDQLGQLAEQHPDWWPGMLTDPQTGAPLITPEVADDMDALKEQIAPEYGVDPQTLTPTNPDSDYVHGNPDPRAPTSLPSYCGWATAACDYYQWVEDHWPDKDPKQYTDTDCVSPPMCTGDEVMCGVARNTWAEKCAVSGDGSEPPEGGMHVVSELDKPDQDLAQADKIDQSGFGYGTACPFSTVTPEGPDGVAFSIDFGPVCDYGPWLRWFLLAWAALKCAFIVGGVSKEAS